MIIGAGIMAGLGSLIGYAIFSYQCQHAQSMIDAEYTERLRSYENEKTAFESAVHDLESIYSEKRQTLCQIRDTILEVRLHLYATGILYDTYQSLPAVCQLLQYFESRRFERLGDAYNQYELEVRLDQIITNMEVIIDQLNKIKDNQIRLREVMQGINDRLYSMKNTLTSCTDSLDCINASTRIGAVCSAISATTNLLITRMARKRLRIGVSKDDLRRLERAEIGVHLPRDVSIGAHLPAQRPSRVATMGRPWSAPTSKRS